MEKVFSASVKDKLNVGFRHLPPFAAHILHHDLEAFVREITRLYREIDVPLFRFIESVDPEKRYAVILASSREMLTLISSHNIEEYIRQMIQAWLNSQMPIVPPEGIHSRDITLVNYIKGRALRSFIDRYTDDSWLMRAIVEEIDQFVVLLNSEMFESYIEIQKQRISNMNTALKKREMQLLEAQEIGKIASFEWDLLGNKSVVTSQFFRIFEKDSLPGINAILEELAPEEREKVRTALDKAFVEGDFYCEFRHTGNNREKFLLSRGKVVFEGGRPVRMVGTITDVTERHNIIEKLKESEKLHKQAQAITHLGNWSWDLHGDVFVWSDEMYRIFGLAPQSEDITYERLISFVHPDDRDMVRSEIQNALETLRVYDFHFQIISARGFVKVLRAKGELIADPHRRPLVMLGTCQDITREYMLTKQLREREKYLEELNQSLQTANQELSRTNEELESFNFIASHDLQEPLRKIQVYSNRILDTGLEELSPSLRDYFTRINLASGRMQKLIEDFLAFSQSFKITQTSERIDMVRLLDEVRMELANRIDDKKARIEVRELPPVYGVPFQMKQLMTNLVSNALKYSHVGVPPQIVITGGVVPGSALKVKGADPEAAYTSISVADNGIGFEAKYATKIFELFQRLHGNTSYSGTGIGLALCKKIVQNMNGFITAESQLGKGSVFTIYVPAGGV